MAAPGDRASSVADFPLFEGLDGAQVEEIGRNLHRKTFAAGATLIVRDQPGHVVYVIAKGSAKVFVERPDGTQVILAVLGRGETIGEMSVIDRQGRSANVSTLEESELMWMDRDDFRSYLERFPVLVSNLTRLLSQRLRLANTTIETLAALDVKGRVARQLLALAVEHGHPVEEDRRKISIPLTQSDLAAMVGASRVRVNQALGELRRPGYISIDPRGFVTVNDWAALSRRAT